MEGTRIIRGRKVIFERHELVGHLRYAIEVFDERDNIVEVLGRLAEVAPAAATPRSGANWVTV